MTRHVAGTSTARTGLLRKVISWVEIYNIYNYIRCYIIYALVSRVDNPPLYGPP